MKDWIKKLSDYEMENLLNDNQSLDKLSSVKKTEIKHMIRNFQDTIPQLQHKQKSRKPIPGFPIQRLSLVFAIVILLTAIPLIVIPYLPQLNIPVNINNLSNTFKVFAKNNIRIKQTANIFRNNKIIQTGANFIIRQNDTILNKSENILNLFENNKLSMALEPQTEVFIRNIKQNKETCFVINKGSIEVNINNSKNTINYLFLTPHASVNVIGTRFTIKILPDDKTLISVQNGYIKVKHRYQKTDEYKIRSKQSVLVNNQEIIRDFKKPGIAVTNQVNKNGNVKSIISAPKNTAQSKWQIKKLYEDKKFKANNAVLSILQNSSQIFVQTQKTIIAFDQNLQIIWENRLGDNKSVIFQSKPFIDKNHYYNVTLQNKLQQMETKTGRKSKTETINGNLVFGNQAIIYNQTILMPLSTGLYSVNDFSKPLISIFNPNTPRIINDHIFITSYVSKTIVFYNKDLKVEWKLLLDSRSFSGSIFINNTIINATSSGILYFIDTNGKIKNTINVKKSITSDLTFSRDTIFFLTDDGFLNKIALRDNQVTEILKIDNEPDLTHYLYKKPLIDKNKLILGNNNGELIILNLTNQKITEQIKISDSPVSCTILPYKNQYLIGTANGSIFALNLKKIEK